MPDAGRIPPRSRKNLERSLDIALKISDHDHCARAYVNLAWFDKEMLNLDGAMRTIEAGLAYCAEYELRDYGTYMRATMAEVLVRQGLWDQAGKEATRVIEYGLPVRLSRFVATLSLARLRTRAGTANSGPLLDFLAEYLVTGKELQRFAPYASLVAERAWLGLFDRQDALRLIDEVEDMAPNPAMIAEVIAWRRRLAPLQGGARQRVDARAVSPAFRRRLAGSGGSLGWHRRSIQQGLALLKAGRTRSAPSFGAIRVAGRHGRSRAYPAPPATAGKPCRRRRTSIRFLSGATGRVVKGRRADRRHLP